MRDILHPLTLGLLLAAFTLLATSIQAQESEEDVEVRVGAGCYVPAAPIIPDGNMASMDELVSAQKAMKMFQSSLVVYRDCLQASLPAGDAQDAESAAYSAEIGKHHDGSVELEVQIADEFNTAVRAYRARQPQENSENPEAPTNH